MLDYRRMLMEDFSLSPEIVLHCRAEIEGHCSGLHRKGRTLHCLMRVGRGDAGAIDANCQRAVSWGQLLFIREEVKRYSSAQLARKGIDSYEQKTSHQDPAQRGPTSPGWMPFISQHHHSNRLLISSPLVVVCVFSSRL